MKSTLYDLVVSEVHDATQALTRADGTPFPDFVPLRQGAGAMDGPTTFEVWDVYDLRLRDVERGLEARAHSLVFRGNHHAHLADFYAGRVNESWHREAAERLEGEREAVEERLAVVREARARVGELRAGTS